MNLSLIAPFIFAASFQTTKLDSPDDYKPRGPVVRFTMQSGRTFEITTDPARSPRTVEHILNLVKKKFYDQQCIHRVEFWVTQWGAPESKTLPMFVKDPQSGNQVTNPKIASGGSGKDIPIFEIANVEFFRGVVGIASTGFQVPGDSQLFILKHDWRRLWNNYAVVGKVTKGMSTVDGIKKGDRIQSAVILTK